MRLNIIIIGTGNVAYHIAESFQKNNKITLLQAFNHRNTKEARHYATFFDCTLATKYSNINLNADLYIIAVKDDAIAEVVKNLVPLKLKGIVVHTSGSVDISVLKPVSHLIGVYYPLQTFFIGSLINWKTTPLLIEANTKSAISILKKLANSISEKVKIIDSHNRLQIHLAAVFACNFTNAMYVSAYEIIENNLSQKDVELLFPIMQQSFQKLQTIHPRDAQTGPAKRNDKLVMTKHLKLLKSNKELYQVYKLLSHIILTQQNSK